MHAEIHDIEIKQIGGHWEVTVNGEFFCSADSYIEAMNELWEVYH